MARRVLLSFLGNSHYKECHYTFGEFQSTQVRFFQEAMVQWICNDWTKKDKIFIFLTPEANDNNWEGKFYQGKGLAHRLQAYEYLTFIPIKNIPRGISEAEIWQLFEQLYECLESEDEVYLDITHGFRSLPMLQTVLLNYAKALKDIQVKKICYGAIEVLGSIKELDQKYPNPTDRIAPIIDLTSFSDLQDWTKAATDFKQYGQIHHLSELTQKSLASLQPKKDIATLNLQQLNEKIQTLIPLLQTNRGKQLQAYPFQELHNVLDQISKEEAIVPPLTAVIQELQKKIQSFQSNDPLIWLAASKWCRQHGLIQQSITQLREGFITYLCLHFQETIDRVFFEETVATPRVIIGNAFTIYHHQLPKSKWQKKNRDHTPLTRKLLASPFIQEGAALFIQLGMLRNDINHGGYQHTAAPSIFYKELDHIIDELENIIKINLF